MGRAALNIKSPLLNCCRTNVFLKAFVETAFHLTILHFGFFLSTKKTDMYFHDSKGGAMTLFLLSKLQSLKRLPLLSVAPS